MLRSKPAVHMQQIYKGKRTQQATLSAELQRKTYTASYSAELQRKRSQKATQQSYKGKRTQQATQQRYKGKRTQQATQQSYKGNVHSKLLSRATKETIECFAFLSRTGVSNTTSWHCHEFAFIYIVVCQNMC